MKDISFVSKLSTLCCQLTNDINKLVIIMTWNIYLNKCFKSLISLHSEMFETWQVFMIARL